MPPNSLREYSIDMAAVESVRMAPLESEEDCFKSSESASCPLTPAVISLDDIEIGSLLGSGMFADVFEVVSVKSNRLLSLDSEPSLGDSPHESRDVARRIVIKKLKPFSGSSPERLRRDLLKEVEVLSGLKHANIISLQAYSLEHDFVLLERVVEDLETWLKRQRDRISQQRRNKPQSSQAYSSWTVRSIFGSRQLVTSVAQEQQHRIRTIIRGLAEGVSYLHQNGILHRDIKPSNIGIDARGVIKLMDFGSARRIGTVNHDSSTTAAPLPSALVGSFVYLAPEVYQPGRSYSFPADVYSFAIVAWETCTLLRPYPELKYISQIQRCVLESGMRPPLRAVCSKTMRTLLKKCWHPNPDKAPTMSVVLETLEQIAPMCRDEQHLCD